MTYVTNTAIPDLHLRFGMFRRRGPPGAAQEKRPHVEIRGIYGGIPDELLQQGKTLADYGINAVWIGSGGLTTERVALLRDSRARGCSPNSTRCTLPAT